MDARYGKAAIICLGVAVGSVVLLCYLQPG
jgi:hypothetical protein